MTELCKLAKAYGTDKYPYYTPLYDALLSARRPSVRSVLEIGIGTKAAMGHVPNYQPGASLRMWRDYFPSAVVYGVDKDPSALVMGERLVTWCGDQSRALFAPEVCYQYFDLILDDGSHDPEDQINTAIALMPLLAPGGLYIIEDVNDLERVQMRLGFGHSAIKTNYGDREGRCIIITR
jgi:hypothetical protein